MKTQPAQPPSGRIAHLFERVAHLLTRSNLSVQSLSICNISQVLAVWAVKMKKTPFHKF
ncbi:MAG: hypothetical protein LBL62_06730 [Planctomycetaceae bacterium]|nr:hypothetical protein [Planctomycetaceae bacterium]